MDPMASAKIMRITILVALWRAHVRDLITR